MPRIRLSDACFQVLLEKKKPITTLFEIRIIIASIFKKGNFRGATVYALEDFPSIRDYKRVVNQLIRERRISRDKDFYSGVFRINELPDGDAEAICCLVDPFCYSSHLSAMENYGLTDRISQVLVITTLERNTWRKNANKILAENLEKFGPFIEGFGKLSFPHYSIPKKVREREVKIHTIKKPCQVTKLREGFGRISSIGQTFADMLIEPDLCGGMRHVVEVWENEIQNFLEQVVETIDGIDSPILKVRAGFILQERLKISNEKIEKWKRFAQRGGSRRLDPKGDYVPPFSETWMISVNV